MEGSELDALRARSSAVFGNRYLAEVVTAVVTLAPQEGDQVTVRMVATRTGLADSLVRPVVKRLVEADLLRPQQQQRPRSASYHEIHHLGGVWEALVKMCALLRSQR